MITPLDIAIVLIVFAILALAGLVYYAATKARRNKLREWEATSYTEEELAEALKRDEENHIKDAKP